MLLVFSILLAALKGCFSKEIFISKSSRVSDETACGNITNPCRNLHKIISTIKSGDILTIDGGENPKSPYQYSFPHLFPRLKSMVLQNWKHVASTDTVSPILRSFYHVSQLNCFGQLTIDFIEFRAVQVFATHECKQIRVNKALFKYNVKDSDMVVIFNAKQTFHLEIMNSVINVWLHTNEARYSQTINLSLSKRYSLCQLTIDQNKANMTNCTLFRGRITALDTILDIHNCTFYRTPVNVRLDRTRDRRFSISHSFFKFGELRVKNKVHLQSCVFDSTPVVINGDKIKAIISNTIFENVFATSELPALHITGNSLNLVQLTGCKFRNNTAKHRNIITSLKINSQQISTGEYGKTIASHKTISNTYFYGSGNNEIMTRIDKNFTFLNTTIICMIGKYASYENFALDHNRFSIQTKCMTCSKGLYSLNHESKVSKQGVSETVNNSNCVPCPYNIICQNGQIYSKGGYWGYITNRNRIKVLPCPPYYCCPAKDQCTSYNTCGVHRTGYLCSQCHEGFSSGITRKYECTSNSKCHSAEITFGIFAVSAVCFVLILMYLNDIILSLRKLLKAKSKQSSNDVNEAEEENSEELGNHNQAERSPQETFILSGLLKIIFFFYQLAQLLRITSVDKMALLFPKFFDFISTMFNVRIDIAYSKLTLCVLPNLNVLQAKLVKLSIIWIAFIVIFLFGIINYSYKILKIKCQKDESSVPVNSETNAFTRINQQVPSYGCVPFIVRVKCVYVQFLLIAFSSISTFCFDVVNCVEINGKSYLYTQASIQCYQRWQYFVISFIVLWVVPFAGSLYVAPKLLYKCYITPTQFLLILTFPLTILCFFFIKKTFRFKNQHSLNVNDAMLAKQLILVLNGPFRQSNSNDSKLCWEAVLIFRRVLMIMTQTFILTSLTRLYPMVMLLLCYVIHHVKMKPFADSLLNNVEFYSLNILLSLGVANIFWAITREYSIMRNSSFKDLGRILMYYEMLVLSFPFLLLILFIFYRVFQKALLLCKCVFNKFINC